MTGIDQALAGAIAMELDALTALMADLGRDLGSDPATLRRHMASLQLIDLVSQTQAALAGVLRTANLGAIPIESLAERLHARLPAEPENARRTA